MKAVVHSPILAGVLIVAAILGLLTGPAQAQPGATPEEQKNKCSPQNPDLIIKWIYRTEAPSVKKAVELRRCSGGNCVRVDLSNLDLTSAQGPMPQRAEIEVCHEKNPWTDVCDVYDCFEDDVGMQSVCNFLYSYNKDCFSDGCGP